MITNKQQIALQPGKSDYQVPIQGIQSVIHKEEDIDGINFDQKAGTDAKGVSYDLLKKMYMLHSA